ncbi:MAG: peptide chain release factor N(5)-glutamine methyltransferase [Clostridiales bacterium]|nr:peptide chain release factor N(5)-glutamine methyltransferase [Clostridiales bacterium]
MAKKEKNKEKKTSIGGQAVMEGVMMRGRTAMATAVRDQDGIIRVESTRIKPVSKRPLFLRLPLVRGCVSFVESMITGTKTLMRSAEVYGEGEPTKFEKWLAEKLKIDLMGIVIGLSLILGAFLAMFLFIWLPIFLTGLLEKIIGGGFSFDKISRAFIEGGVKILVFISYIALASLLKDIKRTFMYHGAEHKTITCYEKGLDLTVENVKKCSRIHDRCGTTYMVLLLIISIFIFVLVEALFTMFDINVLGIYRSLLKIALLPFVAGISYEILKGLSKTQSPLVIPFKIPGILIQKFLTTKEPDDDMIEVAITAFKTVYDMDEDESIETKKFVIPEKVSVLTEKVKAKLLENGIDEEAESEWIVSIVLGINRSDVYSDTLVSPKNIDAINKIVEERITGRPLWYCIGNTEFYGYTINVDERVLIPRPETEELVANALKVINNNSVVLDLCTGSGAIAIAVQKEKNCKVIASDISVDALTLAKENAKLNGAEIEFVESNLFENITDIKFDVILSNPPYIKSEDISSLQKEVKDFEPNLALDGGVDGLDFYRVIVEKAKEYLNPNGYLFLEYGIGQENDIKDMLSDFSKIEIIKDLQGINRIIKAVK